MYNSRLELESVISSPMLHSRHKQDPTKIKGTLVWAVMKFKLKVPPILFAILDIPRLYITSNQTFASNILKCCLVIGHQL